MTIFQIVDDWKLPKDSATKALLDLKVNLFINTPRIFDIYICILWWKIPKKSLMLTYGGGASTLLLPYVLYVPH